MRGYRLQKANLIARKALNEPINWWINDADSPEYERSLGLLRKTRASRKVRRAADVVNGMMYKKFYNSWNICDYKFLFFSKKDWIPHEVQSNQRKWPSIKEAKKLREAWKAWRK